MNERSQPVPKSVEIIVSDNGIGIAEEDLPGIFSQFYCSKRNEEYYRKGTGLGLMLTKALVELHGGEITVRSKPGEGSTFSVRFPVKGILMGEDDNIYDSDKNSEVTDSYAKSENAELLEEQNELSLKNTSEFPLILVVEDDQDLREYIARKLSRDYRVRQAQNGTEGWILTLSSFPDLVISDVIMPEMDGFMLCMKIKNDLRTSHIPVILLTAKSEMENKIQGLNQGADAYLTKPFNLKHLNAQIVSLIDIRRKLIRKFNQTNWLDPNEFTLNKIDGKFLNLTIAYIEANISQHDLNVETLGKELCISRRHLYRKITKLTGESPTDFIRNIRLNKSLELLRDGHLTISEVAYMTGFNTPSHFTSSFRKKYGQSPSKFLKT
jgi:DNA-binding response OmpR family regulator